MRRADKRLCEITAYCSDTAYSGGVSQIDQRSGSRAKLDERQVMSLQTLNRGVEVALLGMPQH
jgi:hypothetical protein